jgi:hypothetical protein
MIKYRNMIFTHIIEYIGYVSMLEHMLQALDISPIATT